MNCAPTLTAEEFKTIHNALWDIRCLCEQLGDSEIKTKLVKAYREIQSGLSSAYEQDESAFARKSRHFESVKAELDLTHAVWSMYEIDNLNDRHPFETAEVLVYRDHWGDTQSQCRLVGKTWTALFVAANACVRDSGDTHHVYIENFRVDKEDPKILYLSTGS